MLKFYFVFAVFCLFQTSNALGSVKKFCKNLGFSKPKLNGAKKTYSIKQNERVKVIDGPRKGQVGEVGPLNVKNGEWPIYLPYEDEFGNKFKKEMVYLKPTNLMILDRRGHSRLTPYEIDVQLWENDETGDLTMDIPRTIEDAHFMIDELKNPLEKKKWKELLMWMLKFLDIYKFDGRPQFYEILTTALISKITDDDLERVLDEPYEEQFKDGYSFLNLPSYYILLKISTKIHNSDLSQRLIKVDQKYLHSSLLKAVRKEDEEMCEFLVQNGANVNFQTPTESNVTPLMGSILYKHLGCFRAIMKSKNINVNLYQTDPFYRVMGRNLQYRSAIHFAAKLGTGDMCKALVKKGANVDDMGEKINGKYTTETPLMIASQYGNLDCMKVLLRHNANIELLNRINDNALAIAKIHDRQECANFLMMYWKTNLLKVVKTVGHKNSKTSPFEKIKI